MKCKKMLIGLALSILLSVNAFAELVIFEIEKQPAEFYPITFEYMNKLPQKTDLVSGTISARNLTDNVDATNVVLDSTSATILGTQAKVKLKAGTNGKRYQITIRVTLTDGFVLEDELYMSVREL